MRNTYSTSEVQIVRIDNLMVRGNSQPAFTASETVEVVVDVFAPDGVDFNACYVSIYQVDSFMHADIQIEDWMMLGDVEMAKVEVHDVSNN